MQDSFVTLRRSIILNFDRIESNNWLPQKDYGMNTDIDKGELKNYGMNTDIDKEELKNY